jgi:hypothetical protein
MGIIGGDCFGMMAAVAGVPDRKSISLKENEMGKGNNSQKNDKKNKKVKKDKVKPKTK